MVLSNYGNKQPNRGGLTLPNWVPMSPRVDDPKEIEHELHEHTLSEFLDTHPHFLPTVARSVNDLIWGNICQWAHLSGFNQVMTKLAIWIDKQGSLVNKEMEETWLADVKKKLAYVDGIGTPNTDTDGNPLPISDGMKFDSVTLHVEAVEDLKQMVEHNHQAHINAGRGYRDPESYSYWSQHGISQPTGYNDNGTPQDTYQFQAHQSYAPYGQQGHPEQPIAGGHSDRGRSLVGLLARVATGV